MDQLELLLKEAIMLTNQQVHKQKVDSIQTLPVKVTVAQALSLLCLVVLIQALARVARYRINGMVVIDQAIDLSIVYNYYDLLLKD